MNLKAFSIAEAFIVMLIISIAMVASAPLISKKTTQSSSYDIPTGAIIYFADTDCPIGWIKLTEKYPKAANAFIRNFDGSTRSLGSFQQSAAPNITGRFDANINDAIHPELYGNDGPSGAFKVVDPSEVARGADGVADGDGGYITFDAHRSSDVYGRDSATEVRPDNIAFLACIKN